MKLTREQIASVTSRELDWLIASELFGWTSRVIQTETCFPEFDVTATPPDWDATRYHRVPDYSSDGNYMLLVLERMRELGFTLEINTGHPYLVRAIGDHYRNPSGEFLTGNSLPETVCRVCLIVILAKKDAQ